MPLEDLLLLPHIHFVPASSAAIDKAAKIKNAKRYQIPITSALVLTIHKSQGLTVQNIILDFCTRAAGSKVASRFVAISRATTLNGIRLLKRPSQGFLKGELAKGILEEDVRLANLEKSTLLRYAFLDWEGGDNDVFAAEDASQPCPILPPPSLPHYSSIVVPTFPLIQESPAVLQLQIDARALAAYQKYQEQQILDHTPVYSDDQKIINREWEVTENPREPEDEECFQFRLFAQFQQQHQQAILFNTQTEHLRLSRYENLTIQQSTDLLKNGAFVISDVIDIIVMLVSATNTIKQKFFLFNPILSRQI